MKKAFSFVLVIVMTFSLAACTTGANQQGSADQTGRSTPDSGMTEAESFSTGLSESDGQTDTENREGGILVAYFSWADNAVLADDVDAVSSPSVIPPGNVQQLAGWVQQQTGGDLFSIQVTDPYSSDWDECLDRANQERGDDARPLLKANVENMDQYNTVFLGYPNWWYGVPMALLSFLEQNDFSGKQVYLFCSHGTGGLAQSVDIITEALPDAQISDNIFDCYEQDAFSSQADIQNWLAGLGY